VAGSGSTTPFVNGVGVAASLSGPFGLASDISGIVYIGDYGNNLVRQIVLLTGAVTTLAGSGTAASTDGTGLAAAFSGPMYVTLDGLGNLYVTDYGSHCIRKVVLGTRAVTTVAGTGAANFADGVNVAAAFNRPRGIVCDSNGNAYVADSMNNRIRKIVLSSSTVTTFAGSATASAANGVGAAAGFSGPISLAFDSSGTLLFVTDSTNHLIRQIEIATRTVTTLAGSAGALGATNGVGVAARFNSPYGLVVDSNGNLIVGDNSNHLIRRIVIATQTVATIAGSGAPSWADGFGTNAAFSSPVGLAMDARGNILVAEYGNNRVRMLLPTALCPAGIYCAPGAEAVACTPGFYCALGGLDRVPCVAGFYCPSGSSAQVACPVGAFHCPAGASAPMSIACTAGYDSLPHRHFLAMQGLCIVYYIQIVWAMI
jgi:serine/threonine-protein kinase